MFPREHKDPPRRDKAEFSVNTRLRCVIAGGGTGGHLFPGIAVAGELKDRFKNAEIIFVTGRRPLESEILCGYGYCVKSIDVEGLKGRGLKKATSVVFKLPKSFFQSYSVIRNFSPDLIIGMGGYSSGPICLAGRIMGVPTAVHEQNSYPGLTNRLLARFVDRVFISFEESRSHLKSKWIFLTGNPVRREIFAENALRSTNRNAFTILVMGGSQGARAINEAFAEAMEYLKGKERIPVVIHQTGETDYERTLEDYKTRRIKGSISPFIKDMATAYQSADLVVGRAGASTIFELAALGKPSILIPYPFAANQHQKVNALSLVRAGGAEMILQTELTGAGLADMLMRYMDDRAALKEMGKRVSTLARRDAAKAITEKLIEML